MGALESYFRDFERRQSSREIVRVSAKADVEVARLDAVQAVAGRAMQGVALVTQLEQQLSQVVPLAASRLQAIGDMHALASAEILAESVRKCR